MGLKWLSKINLPIGQIIYDYGSGMTLTDIGKKYGVSPPTIRKRLEETEVYQLHMREEKVSLELEPRLFEQRGRRKIILPIERVIYDYGSGMTYAELAEKYGVSETTIRKRLIEAGVQQERRGRGKINLPMDQIWFDYESGMSPIALGEKYGVSPPTIRTRLKEAECDPLFIGVKRNRKGEL